MLRDMLATGWNFLDVTTVGVLRAAIPTTGTDGPGAMANDNTIAGRYYRIKKTAEPSTGSLFLNIDSSGYGTAPSVTPVEVYENGALIGTGTITLLDNAIIGTGALSGQSSTIAGSGFVFATNNISGTGSLSSQAAEIDATGAVSGSVSGTGTLVSQAASLAGTGILIGWSAIPVNTGTWQEIDESETTWTEI